MPVSTIDSTGLTASGVTPASLDSNAQYTGFKNRILNGGMVIDQRNAGASITVGGTSYPVDRMVCAAGGTGFTAQRVTGTGAYAYDLLMTGAGGNTSSYLYQRIESYNCLDLKNNNITFQIQLSSTTVTSVTVQLFYANATDNFSGVSLVSSTTITITSTPTIYTWTVNAGANAANGLQLQLVFGAFTSGTIRASGFQIEKGSTATSFDYRPYGTELALCQRYFEKSVSQGTAIQTSAQATFYGNMQSSITNGIWYLTIPFKVIKRAAPTVTTYPYTTATNTGRFSDNVGTDYGAGSAAAGGIYDSQFNIQNNSGGTLAVGSGIVFGSWFASAEL